MEHILVLWSYVWPQEWFLRLVIILMWIVAAIAFQRFRKLKRIATNNLEILNKTEDVSSLEKALLENNIDTNQCFLDYETEKGKNEKNEIVFEHLRAIYDAGIKSSRLDADLLVKNSIDKIFTGIDFLRTSISLFLVIGILGTLAGLAISIGGFNGANFAVMGQTSTTANELSNLFGNLRGAFAPSMWGVFFTITYVFAYAYFIQEKCINRVTEKLTINTIKNWLPVLYPTDFQRSDNSLVKLNATIKNADGINRGVTDLQKNILNSNATLRELTRVATVIKEASDKFEKSSDKVMEIKSLYDELKTCNEEFNTSLQEIVKSAEEARLGGYDEYVKKSQENYNLIRQESAKQIRLLQDEIKGLSNNVITYFDQLSKTMEGNQKQLEGVLQELKAYDANVFKGMNSLQTNLDVSVKGNVATKESLDKLIFDVRNELKQQLDLLSTNIRGLNKPMEQTAALIQQMLEKNYTAMDRLLDDNQKAFTDELQNITKQLMAVKSMTVRSTGGGKGTSVAPIVYDTAGVEQKLDILIQAMEENTKQVKKQSAKDNSAQPFWRKHLVAIVIAALLVISVGVQTAIVVKLGNLEQTQVEVNKVLMRGDMNSNGTTGQ